VLNWNGRWGCLVTDAPLDQALADSVQDVLEKMFFITAVAAPDSEAAQSGECISAWLSFEGDPPGKLTMHLALAAARSIAADFLGEDESSVSGQQVAEVISELTNMVCGSVLSRIESEVSFHLSAPQILEAGASPQAAGSGARTTTCTADVGRGTITVELITEGPACLATEKSAYC
jgi:CheY-specific phosphatase CheX